ncbi:MAG: methyltransferase domain-containing protein [Verrucomicrobia bacterium]|nr:methyltransferase domain-containing protein [Verrucomicrobiota bacterium]MBS0638094.1 methyltransferase domain-containing protein [Verrucomicrobiota bacterium]
MDTVITHEVSDKFAEVDLFSIEQRLRAAKELTLPLEEEVSLLYQMAEFELGRYLLKNRGLNGYWTAYWLIHGPKLQLEHPLEDWLINHAPYFMGSQKRFQIFAEETQKRLRDGMTVASLPCGLMDDLVRLDLSDIKDVNLVGIDIDAESLALAAKNAVDHGKVACTKFIQADAWNLNMPNAYDLLLSNGLNFYERDDARVVELYKQFFKALKPGGTLITSFITPSPALSKESSWINVNPQDALKQKAVFADIMQGRWTAVRTEATTRQQLEEAGFIIQAVIYDPQGVFPTIIAEKP